MTNEVSLYLLLFFVCIAAIMLIMTFFQNTLGNLKVPYLILSFLTVCWLMNEILFFYTVDPKLIQLFYDTKLPIVEGTCISILLLTQKFYRIDKIVNLQFILALLLLPFATVYFAATTLNHGLIRTTFEISENGPMRLIYADCGLWFWIHSAYCCILLCSSILIIMTQHRKLPSAYRMPSVILILGIIIVIITNILSTLEYVTMAFDITVVGLTTSLVLINAAILKNNTSDFLVIARNDIFNFIDETVFILDERKVILDQNISAENWLKLIGFQSDRFFSFIDILKHLNKKGANVKSSENTFNDIDIYFSIGENNFFYNMKAKDIVGPSGKILGIYVTIMNVTKYRSLIHDLEISAGIDALTGLYNRRIYEQKCSDLDKKEFFPLSVIVGDVNGLKNTNDTKGHQVGDLLLRTISTILKNICPNNSVVCRTGGDEFIILLPNTSKIETLNIINNIHHSLDNYISDNFVLSMSMASATKNKEDEYLSVLIHQADMDMYKEKEKYKRRY